MGVGNVQSMEVFLTGGGGGHPRSPLAYPATRGGGGGALRFWMPTTTPNNCWPEAPGGRGRVGRGGSGRGDRGGGGLGGPFGRGVGRSPRGLVGGGGSRWGNLGGTVVAVFKTRSNFKTVPLAFLIMAFLIMATHKDTTRSAKKPPRIPTDDPSTGFNGIGLCD